MAKCRIFKIDDMLKPVVENGLYSKHMFGEFVSVSVVKFVSPKGPDLPAKSHHHGEEASLQIRGNCVVLAGDDQDPDHAFHFAMREGQAMIIPKGAPHFGTNEVDADGACMRLNVVTPPRKEFGPEDTTPYYPLLSKA